MRKTKDKIKFRTLHGIKFIDIVWRQAEIAIPRRGVDLLVLVRNSKPQEIARFHSEIAMWDPKHGYRIKEVEGFYSGARVNVEYFYQEESDDIESLLELKYMVDSVLAEHYEAVSINLESSLFSDSLPIAEDQECMLNFIRKRADEED